MTTSLSAVCWHINEAGDKIVLAVRNPGSGLGQAEQQGGERQGQRLDAKLESTPSNEIGAYTVRAPIAALGRLVHSRAPDWLHSDE